MSNSFIVEHYKHGIGTAILIKNRRQSPDDLFMCSFKGSNRMFLCRKHIDEGEEVWWSNGKPRKTTRRHAKRSSLEDAFHSLFGPDDRANF